MHAKDVFLFPALIVLLTLCGDVVAPTCPSVVACIEEFTSTVKYVGHDIGEYCRIHSVLLKCLTNAQCEPLTQIHKDNELRNYKDSDKDCNSAWVATPGLSIILMTITVWLLHAC
ncbi:uncharacterized protein LOC131936426 [Physella acuta]|uniref:uncharacterized protein LOC131936426 n=1 Tax=Physella acuta TaxID=109671 RepID=UPI0027DBC3FD|nr:uncharacterized protein LOC131936426 [Physella acuta]